MLEGFFKALGFGLCHQLPERSLFAGQYQLPVCARDTGIYAGFILAVVALWLLNRGRKPTELPRSPVLVVVGVFIGLMGLDGVTSYAGLRETTNDLRLLTGLLTGWALPVIAVPVVNSQLWRQPSYHRILERPADVGLWLAGLPLGFVLLRWALPTLGVLYPLLLSLAIISTLVTVNLVFVCLVPFFERKADRLRDAWLQILLALALTALELGAAALLRLFVEGLA